MQNRQAGAESKGSCNNKRVAQTARRAVADGLRDYPSTRTRVAEMHEAFCDSRGAVLAGHRPCRDRRRAALHVPLARAPPPFSPFLSPTPLRLVSARPGSSLSHGTQAHLGVKLERRVIVFIDEDRVGLVCQVGGLGGDGHASLRCFRTCHVTATATDQRREPPGPAPRNTPAVGHALPGPGSQILHEVGAPSRPGRVAPVSMARLWHILRASSTGATMHAFVLAHARTGLRQ